LNDFVTFFQDAKLQINFKYKNNITFFFDKIYLQTKSSKNHIFFVSLRTKILNLKI